MHDGITRPERFVCLLVPFISFFSLGVFYPLIPHFSQTYSLSPFLTGALAASFPLAEGLTGPLLGTAADRGHARPGLVTCFASAIGGDLLFFVGDTFPSLVAAAILCGAASGGLAIGQSYVLRKSRDTRRVKILGSFGVARNAGYIAGLGFGAAIAIFPDANLQHRAGFLIPAALALGAGVPAARFLSKSPLVPNAASRMNSRDAITHTWREARESLTFIGLRTFTYLGLVTLFPYVLQGWFGFSISQTALAFVGMALLGVLAQGKLAGWLERQANLTCGIAIGFGLLGIGGACVSVYSLALWPFYIGVACVVIGYQLLIPFQLADLSKRVSKGNDGLGIGLALVAASIIGPLGPLVFGGIATIGTFEWSFGFATTVALIIFGFLVRRCFEYTTLQ